MFDTVVNDRKRIHTELRHLAQLLQFTLTKTKNS